MKTHSTNFVILSCILATIILIQAQYAHGQDVKNKNCNSINIDGIFYKTTLIRNLNKFKQESPNNLNVFNISGITYTFVKKDISDQGGIVAPRISDRIYTEYGLVFERNGKLLLDSKRFHKILLIETIKANCMYDMVYDSQIKKVFILPLPKTNTVVKKIILLPLTNYDVANETVQTVSITLPTCSIKSMTMDPTSGNMLLGAKENEKNVLILLEKFLEEPCFTQIPNDNNFKTYIQNITDYTIQIINENCPCQNNRGRPPATKSNNRKQKTNFLVGFQSNFKSYMDELYRLHYQHAQDTKEDCLRTCPYMNTQKEDEILATENRNLRKKIDTINEKFKQFQRQIHTINDAFKKLPFNAYQNMTYNKITNRIQNKRYDCFLQSDVQNYDESNENLFTSSNDVLENLEALENETANLIELNDEVLVEVE